MTVQKRLSQIGFAKQTGKGTAATAPSYLVGLASGDVYSLEFEESDLNTTWSDRILQGHDRIHAIPGSDAELICTPQMLGLLLMLALGQDTVTGAAAPYTHTFSPATALPWATLFGSYGSDKTTLADCKVDTLEFSWDKTGALKLKIKSMGRSITFASAWTPPAASAQEQVAGNVFKGAGGTFQVGGASARVVSGTIKVENGLAAIVAAYSTTPDEIAEAMVKCDVSLTIVPDDLSLFRSVVTGSATGTAVQVNPQYGDINCKWIRDTNTDLTFDAPHTKFMTKMPSVDANGGAAEITLEGSVSAPASGAPFTFALRNSVATY